jgi:hypothetical protein
VRVSPVTFAVVSLIALAAPLSALAQTAATAPTAAAPPPTAAPTPTAPAAPESGPDTTLPPAPMVERKMPKPEQLIQRPSGFWTPNRPAVGGSYRYGKMVVGVIVATLMGLFTIRLVRRHSQGRSEA